MLFFLDTNVCIFALRGEYPSIGEHLRKLRPGDVKVAATVEAELLLGAEKSRHPRKSREKVEEFLSPLETIPFDKAAAQAYARTRAHLEKRGTVIGPNDLILAATVLVHDGTLVSHNVREFRRVPRLNLVDWCP